MNAYRLPYPNELYHHGVQGQKWGVRHGPPYPLKNGFASRRNDGEKHSWYEKKMARKEKRAINKYEKYSKKKDSSKKESGKNKYEKKMQKARAKVESISELGQKYYSLDKTQRKKISRGYAATRVVGTMVLPFSLPVSVVGSGVIANARANRKISRNY